MDLVLDDDDIKLLKSKNLSVGRFIDGGCAGSVFAGQYIKGWSRRQVDRSGNLIIRMQNFTAGFQVAIKTINYTAEGADAVEAEIATFKEVHHPNVTEMYEVIHRDVDQYGMLKVFIVMELASCDLKCFLEKRRSLKAIEPKINESVAKSIGLQIISGLSALHATGRYHGDVKPANFLVFEGQQQLPAGIRIKVADFNSTRKPTDGNQLQTGQLKDIQDCYGVFLLLESASELSEKGKKELRQVKMMMGKDFQKGKTPKKVLQLIRDHQWFR